MKNWLSIYNLNIESILNGLSDNVYFIDTQGRLIWCNDQQAKSYGFSPNEVIGKTIAELGELSQWSQETIEQLYKNNELIMKMGTPQIFEETVQIGSHIKTFLSHKNALKDSQGNIIGVIGNSTDITQKKSLESIGVNFEEILNTLTNNIYCLDKDGNIIWCNKNQALSLGIPNPAIFIGKTLLNVAEILNWDTTFFKELQKNNMEVIKSGKAKICEETPSTADGSKKTFLSHKNPIFNSNGEVTGLIGIAVDITEKKLNEQLIGEKKQLEKVMESLHTLASSLAHELRTPLVGIQQGTLGLEKYFSKLIESYQIAEAAKLAIPDVPIERLQEVLNNTNKMVNQSLMFIELSLANMSMRKIQTDTFITISMLETINTAIDEYPFQGNERTFVHWDPDQQTDFNYLGNLILTKHIFFNLIKNALYFIKAERKGEITIQLIQNGKENRVIFRDTAKGMDDETLSHLFESFYTNTQFGTGIGLAYCKMVMEAYEGDIVCHAEEGKLTEFTLIFPKLG